MIFQRVTTLRDTVDKNYFREKIDIYIKIIDAVCKKYDLSTNEVNEDECLRKIKEMGIIENNDDLVVLRQVLRNEDYDKFLKAVNTEIENIDIISPFTMKLNNQKRKALQLESEKKSGIRLVDLFCGAGGLSLGFRQSGYKTIFANDFDRLCIETYKYNHPEIASDKVVCGDIREISQNIEDYIKEDVDIVIGGPPCQGFSSANKHHRVIDDPRNELYKYFIKCVEKLGPKIVVMENVKGMLKVADQVVEDYEKVCVERKGKKLNYLVAYRLLMSSDFSVAQSRERLIYIAIRSDVVEKKRIRPEQIFEIIKENNSQNKVFNLEEALEGLRPLVAPNKMGVGEIDSEEGGRKIDLNLYLGDENAYLKLINENRKIPLVFNHKARYCSDLNHEIYSRMHQGDDATDPKISDIMPYAHRNDKFKDKYYRLYADRPCRTITAHLRSDCHSHIHPFQDRGLTPREAARVQSFPDDYLFMGPYLKTYIQIGNAVPVVMARGIATAIKELFNGENNDNL